ncbi:MAG: aminotransferase class IV [Kiritimatiellia bacterium]|jgi:branched-chain amino acid aminotransferase|nr:aminotransferase class IV [Kiritimatiellia bacterium]
MQCFDASTISNVYEAVRAVMGTSYLAMYSSVYGGIVTDAALMAVPIDDHMVHRGDGVFETMKCVDGSVYNMAAHLDRLEESAETVALELPVGSGTLGNLIVQTVRAGGEPNCVIRVLASRGPGSFGVNPYDNCTPQLYIVVTRLGPPFMTLHPEGATLRTSSIQSKPPFLAGAKSCNYLPNVLMQKESVDLGADFVVSFDENGFMAEGPTENVGIISPDGELLFPALAGILSGTTMLRVVDLAGRLVDSGDLKAVCYRDISREDVKNAAEILIVGTTRNVIAVREYDGSPVGGGSPGPRGRKLGELLLNDIANNEEVLTKVF